MPCLNAALNRALAEKLLRKPIVGTSGRCPRAASGHNAAPLTRGMNSRRLMASSFEGRHLTTVQRELCFASQRKMPDKVRVGSPPEAAVWALKSASPAADIAP